MQASAAIKTSTNRSRDLSQSSSVSPTAIVIALLMAACFIALTHDASYLGASEEMSVERGAGLKQHEKFEKDVSAAPMQRQIAFLVLLGIGGYCFLTHRRDVAVYFGLTALLMCACLLLVVTSLLWSIDRGETAKEVVRILAYFFIAASLAMRFRPREICLVLATMGIASSLFALSLEVVSGNFQPWNSGYRLTGTIHSNVLASHAVVGALACFAFYQSVRKPRLILAILMAMLMIVFLTKTRGAIATSFIGLGTIFFAKRSPYAGLLAVSLLISSFCVMALLYMVAGSEVQHRVQNALLMGRSEGATTLTGRLPLWQELWDQSKEHRWMGHGYGAFWTVDRMEDLEGKLQWYPGHAHSAYVHTMLDIGLVGLACYLMLAIICLLRARNLIRSTQDPSFYFVFGLFAAGFVDGLVEVSFVYPRGLGLIVAIAMFSLVMVHAPMPTLAKVNRQGKRDSTPSRVRHNFGRQVSC